MELLIGLHPSLKELMLRLGYMMHFPPTMRMKRSVLLASYLNTSDVFIVWPGTNDELCEFLDTSISLLSTMIDPDVQDEDMDFLELWDNDPEVM
jgi:hypothetical protein